MQTKRAILIFLVTSALLGAQAAEFTTTTVQGSGATWSGAIWQGTAPTAGNTYRCVSNGVAFGNNQANTRIRNPAFAGGVQTFPGDSLTLDAHTEIRAKQAGAILNFPGVSGNPGLILNGGILNAGDTTVFEFRGAIRVVGDSLIAPGDNGAGAIVNGRGIKLNAALSGDKSLILIQGAVTNVSLEVVSASNTYSGTWVVKAGYLKGSVFNALGSGSITIDPAYAVSSSLINPATILAAGPAFFEVNYDLNSPGTLTLANGALMILHQDIAFANVLINGSALSAGAHSYAELAATFPANFAANGSGSITVTPQTPTMPAILSQPASRTNCPGSPATFSVAASGTPPLAYEWYFNDTLIPEATGSNYAVVSPTSADAGAYKVMVSNSVGSVMSQPATLTMQVFCSANPSVGYGQKMAFDARRGQMVLFGGVSGYPGNLLTGTWLWNGVTWASVPAASPPPRISHAMAYDSIRQRVVLFGGDDNGGTASSVLSDTWLWDGINWTPFSGDHPPARTGHALVFDAARGEAVLFGGRDGAGVSLNDTWVWNGVAWTQKAPDSAPSPRKNFAMAYDAARRETILFSGENTGWFADTWAWNGTNWFQRAPANSPQARHEVSAAFDLARQEIVLFGGRPWDDSVGATLDDTWVWDGSNWILGHPVGAAPPTRRNYAFAYDSLRGAVVLEGGYNSEALDDTWLWNGTNWTGWSGVDTCLTPSGLLGWWRGNGNATDVTGRSNGALSNGVSFAPGLSGQAFAFDGVNDYVDIGQLSEVSSASGLTIAAWIKWTDPTKLYPAIVSKWQVTPCDNNNSFILYTGQSESGTAGKGVLYLGFDDNNCGYVAGTHDLAIGDWVFLTATWRNSDGQMVIYKNGVADGSSTGNGVGRHIKHHTEFNGKIGDWGLNQGTNALFTGLIDEVAIFDRALSADEIAAIYTASSAGMCERIPACATDLLLTQSANPTAVPVGSNVTYTIVVNNPGAAPVTGVTVSDSLPDGASFVSAMTTQGSCGYANGSITCALGPLTSGASAIITAVLTPLALGTLTNTALVTSSEPDCNNADNAASQIVKVLPRPTILVNGNPATPAILATNLVQVEINPPFPSGATFYSLDGSYPGLGSFYTGPFTLASSATVRALAYTADYEGAIESLPVTVFIVASPRVVEQPQNALRLRGSSVTFSATATGAAPLTYQWFSGEVIPDATNASLTILNVQTSNAGGYAVRVSNPSGSDLSASANLTVYELPSIAGQPINTRVFLNNPVTFSILAGGSPPLHYQWRHNGVNLTNQTNASLSISHVQVTDGGTYTVIVGNDFGTLISDPAQLIVETDPVQPGDYFTNAVLLAGASGLVSGTNTFATKETGEPNHGGKSGGRSVWYKWRAPFTGIATFSTVGSTFDTLLGIYQGTSVTTLTTIASDEDSGGSLTSLARFNVTNGVEYAIAIDGFGASDGYFLLGWNVLSTLQTIPVITEQPHNVAVLPGSNALFSVTVSGQGLFYQWLFNDQAISGATDLSLKITDAQIAKIGFYSLLVSNSFGQSVISSPATLELVSQPSTPTEDKFEDVNAFTPTNHLLSFPKGRDGFTSVSLGAIGYQYFQNLHSSSDLRDPAICAIGGASRWWQVVASTPGIMSIDTVTSRVQTVIAVYRGGALSDAIPANLVTCDINSAPDGHSLVRFPVQAGVTNSVLVDGVNGAAGLIYLHYSLGIPPTVGLSATTPLVAEGGTLSLIGPVSGGTPPPSYQWYQNGAALTGANNQNLVRNNVSSSMAGVYSLMASNIIGVSSNVVAYVTVEVPLHLNFSSTKIGDAIQFHLLGSASHGFYIQGTTNFLNWIPIYTNLVPNTPINFLDPAGSTQPRRFYRAIPTP